MKLPTLAEIIVSFHSFSKNLLENIINEHMHKEVKYHTEKGIGLVTFKDDSKLLVIHNQYLKV